MTSGVSRSGSLPCSATAGEAKTSAIKAMQTLRTHANESGKCLAWSADRGFNMRIQAENSDRTRKSGKICRSKDLVAIQAALGCSKLAQLVESQMGLPTCVRPRPCPIVEADTLVENSSPGRPAAGGCRRRTGEHTSAICGQICGQKLSCKEAYVGVTCAVM